MTTTSNKEQTLCDLALRARDSSPGSEPWVNSKPGAPSSARGFAKSHAVLWYAKSTTTAATPSGSNASLMRLRLMSVTPSGSKCNLDTEVLTPEGSQILEIDPNATTTPEGSQPVLCVRDSSGKPGAASSPRGLKANSRGAALITTAK